MKSGWRAGNRVELLENGDQFYPLVFRAIEKARREVIVETFILREDAVGHGLARVLAGAARRGVRVEVTVDAWGSMSLGRAFIDGMTRAGVCFHLFEQKRPRWLLRVAWFRRLHRKLVIVDGTVGFIGGINFSEDHVFASGPGTKQDYAVRVEGPVVSDMHALAWEALEPVHGARVAPECPAAGRTGSVRALFVHRDNQRGRRTAIEQQYRRAIRGARHRVIIANAYFFPGHLLLREICRAARRGVDVRLLMQAEPDLRIVRFAERLLYDHLLESGVKLYEYRRRQYHGKVALVDGDWVTVGSSNLDPLSLWFNLEANLIVRDRDFNRLVHERMAALIGQHCRRVTGARAEGRAPAHPLLAVLAFHFLRRFPRVAGLFPAHRPRLTAVGDRGASDDEAA
ncbi:MAG: cardiolipin synthase ClsB [Pseudomonadota bacterium]